MDVKLAASRPLVRLDWRRHAPALSLSLIGLISLISLAVAARRISGALTSELPSVVLWSAVCVVALACALASQLSKSAVGAGYRSQLITGLAGLAALALFGWALAVPGTSTTTWAILWLIVTAYAGFLGRHTFVQYRRTAGDIRVFADKPETATVAAPTQQIDSPRPLGDGIRIDPPQTPAPHFPTEDVAQQLVRRLDGDGSESISGWVRATFEVGQRSAWAHVAFCPPLEGEVAVAFEQVDGPTATVKVGQVLAYGVRFDVKLSEPADEAASVLIEFVATARAAARAT